MDKLRMELFVPPNVKKAAIDYKRLFSLTGRSYQYASRGRHAIYHILKALEVKSAVIVPCYACHTIMEAIEAAGLQYVFCDINRADLNISFESFVEVQKRTEAKCVIVPSLYGNPAQLDRIWNYCEEQNIKMIDDSAQSFGAILNGRYLSSFGNAGLFAFSPGKATPGAMGACFWTENNYFIKRRKHDFLHRIIWLDYMKNRKNVYNAKVPLIIKKILRTSVVLSERFISVRNDEMADFENKLLGGMIKACIDGDLVFRNKWVSDFYNKFHEKGWFEIVMCQQGIPMNHKIVIILSSHEQMMELRNYLLKKGIQTFDGYKMEEAGQYPVAESVVGKILELPIENSKEKMNNLFGCVRDYFQAN